jgi:uncharacterized protein
MAASPCVGICRLDKRRERCVGCGRTLAEIAAWTSLSEAEQRAIMQKLTEQSRRPRD